MAAKYVQTNNTKNSHKRHWCTWNSQWSKQHISNKQPNLCYHILCDYKLHPLCVW